MVVEVAAVAVVAALVVTTVKLAAVWRPREALRSVRCPREEANCRIHGGPHTAAAAIRVEVGQSGRASEIDLRLYLR
eukprot:COSAG02_NODE_53624_length_300_cov_1.288557_1_plen_76_part_01